MSQSVRKWIGIATGLLSFAYLIFVMNPVQMLSVLIYPFSPRLFREVNRWCARSVWGLWVIIAEVQNGIEVRFSGDDIGYRDNAIVISNHQSMTDVMVMLCFAWRCGRIGDLKFFVKDVIKYVPGVGWGMKFLDCVFVKRDWMRDRGAIDRLFGKYRAENIPVFLVSYLEGTRLTEAKLEGAQAFARERGLYVPEHTLVPRTNGFSTTMTGLRNHLDAVYDLTIGYREGPHSLGDCFQGRVTGLDVHIRRFPVDSLPTDDEALKQWVFDRYREKDELLARYKEDGVFPGATLPGRVRAVDWLLPEGRRPTHAARVAGKL